MNEFVLGNRKLLSSCGCGGSCAPSGTGDIVDNDTVVKVLGMGCAKCGELKANVQEAIKQLGADYAVAHITELPVIMEYGVMSTPALVMKEEVVSTGKVLSVDEVKALITEKMG